MTTLELWHGDCLERMAAMPDESVVACVSDPPYGLSFMGHEWDTFGREREYAPRVADPKWAQQRGPFAPGYSRGGPNADVVRHRCKAALLYEHWSALWLAEAYRILQSGGLVKAFSGTRTYHRLVRAMKTVGFVDVRLDAWGYGAGFPKSSNISKMIDKRAKAERKIVGYKRGVGGENMNDLVRGVAVRQTTDAGGKGVGAYGTGAKQVPVDVPITIPATELAELWDGYGTALKPAWEPIVVGRKP